MSDEQLQRAQSQHAAEFLDGWSLAPHVVRVELAADGLRVLASDGRVLASWARAGLSCDAMQAGVVHVTHRDAPHETLVVSDPALEEQVLSLCPEIQAVPGGKRRLRFVLACLGLLVAIASALYLAIPGLSRQIARRIPLAKERALGAQLELIVERSTCAQPPAQKPLEQLLSRLGGRQFQVRIMRDPMPNAFALPGGIILVSDALLADAESPDEVAGVLAHEIEHITQRHVLAGVVRDAILTGLWSLTVGDYAGLLVLDPSTAYRVANLEFSRADEAAADAGALARLRQAHIRQDGLATFFERLGKRYGGDAPPKWLSTHPSHRERVEVLRRAPPLPDARPALSTEDFALLQRGCEGAEAEP